MAKREDPIDALFKLPLADFIGARKELSARLKKSGQKDEAASVNALGKPPVSAWAVNQLFWNHREAFDELMATGQRFRKAQASGKVANMREALEARREALSQLSDLVSEVLTDGGHNPSLDTLRRITSTLEALSASTSDDGPTPGRLTHDVDPPGFDSFGSFVPSAVAPKRAPKPPPSKKAAPAASKIKEKTAATADAKRREARQSRINAAKALLQTAKKALTAAQAQAKSLEAAQKRAEATSKEAEKQKRHAEERLAKATAAAEDAAQRAESIAAEAAEAVEALAEAKRNVEKATRELEASFGE
jgi:hypothetical protein